MKSHQLHYQWSCWIQCPPQGNCELQHSRSKVWGKLIEAEGSVLPKVTDDQPTIPIASVRNWKHLFGLELADPD